MKRIGRFLAWIGGITIVLFTLAIILIISRATNKPKVPARTVLEIDLETDVVEDVPDDPLAQALMSDAKVMRDLIEGLERASADDRVAGAVVRIGAAPMSMAEVQELRDAIAAFRAKGKFAVAFSETFGEFGDGGRAYYLATACDEIWLQPSGDLGLTGLLAQSPFLRGTLDKISVKPQMDHRYEYKNAMNLFTEKKFTPAHKEATEKILTSMHGQLVRGIAAGRKLGEADVRAAIDRGPLLAKEALDAKLVDGLAYRQEVYDRARAKAGKAGGKDAQFLYLRQYLARAGRLHEKGKKIALIYGVGGVERGKSGAGGIGGESSMGSDTVTEAFRKATADKDVKAILFRVDSPGGSYVASDAIWQEVVRARKAGKPVIVSMGSVAGSGGYFVAMAADKIVAQPGTITGSIGVLGGKMNARELWAQLGVTFDEVHVGQNARIWSQLEQYSPAEWARFQAMLDRIYDDFTTKVAEGRKLPKAKVLEIAKGRVWTGEDAKANGLVDALGGMSTALALAKQAAGIPDGDDVELAQFPPKKSFADALLEKLRGEEPETSEPAVPPALVKTLRELRPVVRQIERLGLQEQHVLSMPPLDIQ